MGQCSNQSTWSVELIKVGESEPADSGRRKSIQTESNGNVMLVHGYVYFDNRFGGQVESCSLLFRSSPWGEKDALDLQRKAASWRGRILVLLGAKQLYGR